MVGNPFTGRKKRKAWNKTWERYVPVKENKTQLKQTGDIIL